MYDKVLSILEEYADISVEDVTSDSLLISDLGLNSINIIEIVTAFEDMFDIEISDRSITGLRTVGDIVVLLENIVG